MFQSQLIFEINLISLFDYLGTFAFAISGIKMAYNKQIDWFGAYVIGLVTAIGGGTIRDLFLGTTPFWMIEPKYLITTGFALVTLILFKSKLSKWGGLLFIFDTIGLGFFTIVGINKSIEAGFPTWVCILMGTITASTGGVIRDILLNQIPLLFQREIYAIACLLGGIMYFTLKFFGFNIEFNEISSVLTVVLIRFLSVKYRIHLPQLK